MEVQGQPMQTVRETPSPKLTRAKWTGGSSSTVPALLAQSHVFKHQSHQKKQNKITQNKSTVVGSFTK
jgi:hypothetical protein